MRAVKAIAITKSCALVGAILLGSTLPPHAAPARSRIVVNTTTLVCPTERLMYYMESAYMRWGNKLDASGHFSLMVPFMIKLKADGCYKAPAGSKGYLAGPATGEDGFPRTFVPVRLDGNPAVWWVPLFNISPTTS